MQINPEQLYIYDPRFEMTVGGRFLVRAVGSILFFSALITTIAFLFSDAERPGLVYAGIFLMFFLVDFTMHRQNAKKVINHKVREEIKKGTRINIADFLPLASFQTLIASIDKTRLSQKSFFLNLLVQLCGLQEIKGGLMRMDVDPKEFYKKALEHLDKSREVPPRGKVELLLEINEFMKFAFVDAVNNNDAWVEPHDVFSALFHVKSEDLARIFGFFEIEEVDLENSLIFGKYKKMFSGLRALPATLGGFAHRHVRMRSRTMNRAWTARPTKTLDRYSTDLTALARTEQVGFMVGHKTELERLVDVLSRPLKSSGMLVGEPGSGRETIVAHLAFLIIRDHVPATLFDKRLVELSIGNLVAGAEPSELQSRMKKIIDEILAAGNVILYIPDIHNLLRTSGTEFLSAADVLLPYISKGTFQTIGASDPRDYKRIIEPNADFANALEVIRVEEISEEEATRLLVYSAIILERYYKILVSYKAVKKAVALAQRYLREKLLPSSAEDLLKEALADAKEKGLKVLREDEVIAITERKVRVPIHRATKEEAQQLLNLEEVIHARMINQDEAVTAVSQALREYRSGLSRRGGPIAAFLFVGPTGVGKTELSKILAQIQFGSESAMIRFDMSEFQEKQSLTRFTGSSDGEVPGQLTEAVRLKPFSLVLLDEFEKAHPDIFNLFLQVFDDGRLTDGMGNVIDFTNTILIATSNAHSDFVKAETERGRSAKDIAQDLKKMLSSFFRPELLNRFSGIIVFRTLSLEHIEQIAAFQLKGLAEILDETHGIKLLTDQETIRELARLGYDPVFGARPLRGVISDRLKSKLANALLQGEVKRGERVRLSFANGDFVFTKEAA
ncbi:MAG: hypothetical protein A3J67_02485 [Parcubacteria group bacterium RIFCSPHIGHO2_02_FULL_48_10b]|nr:MAG: hypothetical protein A3J67_02485 [Parcubacteria group bacterium RIFCSPHIGHO2_02_FULL_48_10b]